jgi:ribosomal protein S18 acetylase RimI-like enzyme
MPVVEVAPWFEDTAALSQIDASFTTDLQYRVTRDDLAFCLRVEQVAPPVKKTLVVPSLTPSDRLLAATIGGEIVGLGELGFDSWNLRARIQHLYVAAAHRRRGVGKALIHALGRRASEEPGMRCLWLETQNVNYPAIQFYRRMGFRLCGFDETLYPPSDPAVTPGEIALFFAREL